MIYIPPGGIFIPFHQEHVAADAAGVLGQQRTIWVNNEGYAVCGEEGGLAFSWPCQALLPPETS